MNRLRLGSHTRRWLPRTVSLNVSARYPQQATPTTTTTQDHDDSPTAFDTLATIPASSSLQAPVEEAGSRVAVANERRYLGVNLPVKPSAPGAQDCCQSGCALCVYDIYLDEVQLFHEKLAEAKATIQAKAKADGIQLSNQDWPEDVLGPIETNVDQLDPKVQAEQELERTRSQLDPALRAFLEMEARLKKKEHDRKASLEAATGSATAS